MITRRRYHHRTKPSCPAPAINWAHPLGLGLIGCYLFNELDVAIYRDIAKAPIDGTSTLIPVRVNGPFGARLEFDATDDYIVLATPAKYNLTNTLSWVTWCYFRNNAGGLSTPIIHPTTGYFISRNSTDFTWGRTGVAHDLSVASALTVNTLYHLVATMDGAGGVTLYIDGVQRASGTVTTVAPSGNLQIGHSTWPVDGFVDHVLFYNRVLTGAEVKQLYLSPFCFLAPAVSRPLLRKAAGATPVSNAFVGAHEALALLRPTFAAAHESMALLAASLQAHHEGLVSLAQVFSGNHEGLIRLLQTFDGRHEALALLAASYESRHEALLPLLQTFQALHEAVVAVSQGFIPSHEALALIQGTFTPRHEGTGNVVAQMFTAFHEALASVLQTAQASHEGLKAFSQTFQENQEGLVQLAVAFAGLHEGLLFLLQTFIGRHENAIFPILASYILHHEGVGVTPAADSLLDFEQIIKLCYDPVNKALKIKTLGAASGQESLVDFQQAIKNSFDQALGKLRVVT